MSILAFCLFYLNSNSNGLMNSVYFINGQQEKGGEEEEEDSIGTLSNCIRFFFELSDL